jgi:hypothetical protein
MQSLQRKQQLPKRSLRQRPSPENPPSKPSEDSAEVKQFLQQILPVSLANSTQVDLSKMQAVLKKFKSNPDVAYVLASLRKGLSHSGVVDPQLVEQVKAVLQRSPTILRALAEYKVVGTGQ